MMKKLALILFLCSPAYGSYQAIPGMCGSGLMDATATEYYPVMGGGTLLATSSTDTVIQIVSANGKLHDLHVEISGTPGGGNSYAFTLYVNNTATALTCTISGAVDTTCADTSNQVSVSAGDEVFLEVVPTSSPTTRFSEWTMTFSGDTAAESLLMSASGNSTTNQNNLHHGLIGMIQAYEPTEIEGTSVIPTTGTISDLYVINLTDPGAGSSRVHTLYVNGVATALTCTVSDTNTHCSDVTNSTTVYPGDLVYYYMTLTGFTGTKFSYGAKFTAETDGEFIMMATGDGVPSNATTSYGDPTTGDQSNWSTSGTLTDNLISSVTLKSLYVVAESSPGSGNTWVFTVQDDGSDTALTVTFTDADQSGNFQGSADVTTLHQIDLASVPTSSPTQGSINFSIAAYITPPAGAGGGGGGASSRRRIIITQ